jgi:hypothetical protein
MPTTPETLDLRSMDVATDKRGLLQVFAVENGALLLCLADRITPAWIDAVAARQPLQFICLDPALHGDDALKVNALETLHASQLEIQFRTV